MGRDDRLVTPVYLSLELLMLVICFLLVLVSIGQKAYQQTLDLFSVYDTSIRM